MRHQRFFPITALVCATLTGCAGRPAIHVTARSTPSAIIPLVGAWQADYGKGGNHASSLLAIDSNERFQRRDELRLKGSGITPVVFAGHIEPAGGRVYRFVDTMQGAATMAPHAPLTFTLSADGSELSYQVSGDRITYHRVPSTAQMPG
jgi:hypothetical protein